MLLLDSVLRRQQGVHKAISHERRVVTQLDRGHRRQSMGAQRGRPHSAQRVAPGPRGIPRTGCSACLGLGLHQEWSHHLAPLCPWKTPYVFHGSGPPEEPNRVTDFIARGAVQCPEHELHLLHEHRVTLGL